jgi:hypothetical protein
MRSASRMCKRNVGERPTVSPKGHAQRSRWAEDLCGNGRGEGGGEAAASKAVVCACCWTSMAASSTSPRMAGSTTQATQQACLQLA